MNSFVTEKTFYSREMPSQSYAAYYFLRCRERDFSQMAGWVFILWVYITYYSWLPHWLRGKESTYNAGDHLQCRRCWFNPWEDPLEKEMATHSSILAWEIPWTDESGGL